MLKRKNTYFLLLFTGFVLILFTSLVQQGTATPDQPGQHTCHSVGPYSISTTNSLNLQATKGGTFDIIINATGPNMNVEIIPVARDNSKFQVSPSNNISDNSANDHNSTAGGIDVLFTFTAPTTDGSFKVLILALDPTQTQPDFAYLEFVITVGAGGLSLNPFSHLSIYFGLAAVLSLLIGTLLYENNNQLTQVHGFLAAIALILTTINIIFIIPMTTDTINSWVGGAAIDWLHLIHITFGIIGYGAGVIAMLTGLSGIRTKKPGYVALIFWSFNFVFGLMKWGIAF